MRSAVFSLLVAAALIVFSGVYSHAAEEASDEELKDLRQRVEELEKSSSRFEERTVHYDKHILHAEEAVVRVVEGLEFSVGATGVLQGTSGVDYATSLDGDRSDATVSFDFEIQSRAGENGLAFASIEAGRGDGLDGKILTLSGLNGDATGDAGLGLSELWYEHLLAGDILRLRAGQIDVTSDFDTNMAANDETSQFLSGGFINNLAVEFPDDNGFGAMLWVSPAEVVGIGLTIADSGWDNVFDSAFYMAEVDIKPVIAGGQGNYRIYVWLNDKPHVTHDGAKEDDEGTGMGVSLDQALGGAVTLFARLGVQDEDIYRIDRAWSAGLEYSMAVAGREDDALGFAWGVADISGKYKDANPGTEHDDEFHAEAYYRLKVNEKLFVSPDLQWVDNAGGNGAIDDFYAFGVRAQLSF